MLKIVNITKQPRYRQRETALENVSLTLEEGDFVTVIGGNGAGKSTLLNCVAGLYPADSGDIFIDGIRPNCPIPRAKYPAAFSGP